MYRSLYGYLKEKEVEFKEYYKLSDVSTIRIGGNARFYISPVSQDSLVSLISFLKSENISYKIVGGMSNILFSDEECGVIISTKRINKKAQNGEKFSFECGATLASALRFAAERGYGGAESLFAIPGTIGASVRGNAGAFGLEISDVFVSGKIYFPDNDKVEVFEHSEMKFAYRHSVLKDNGGILLFGEFSLFETAFQNVVSKINAFSHLRHASQPVGIPSLGSVFKKSHGVGAGYYIDKLGLKGFRHGGAAISEKHAGFIVNLGGATAKDVKFLIEYVKEKVFSSFGVSLFEEIEIL